MDTVQFSRPQIVTNARCCSDSTRMCPACARASLNAERGMVVNPGDLSHHEELPVLDLEPMREQVLANHRQKRAAARARFKPLGNQDGRAAARVALLSPAADDSLPVLDIAR